jgi:uncharacterized integral membrane protein
VKDVFGLASADSNDRAATSASGDVSDLAIDQPPAPEAAPAREAPAKENGTETAATANEAETAATANEAETRAERLRRHARQVGLHAYAVGVVVLVAFLIALAASNTADVKVNWLFGSAHVSLVWLVLVTAVIAWVLGLLASVRFQWLTRARRR